MEQPTQSVNQEQQPLTKRERRLQKREKEAQERISQIRGRKIKKFWAISLPALLIIGGITFAAIKFSSSSSDNDNQTGTPKMEISPSEYDMGAISMAAGKIIKTFEIKNTGDGDLKIDGIRTSCHCTTARLKVGEKTSSDFGMDGSAFWSQKIAPKQIGYLEVTFDPAYHGPQGLGSAIRAIYFESNDSQNKQSEVRLIANVTP